MSISIATANTDPVEETRTSLTGARASGITFEMTAPMLTAFRGTGTFELTAPTLTAFRGTGTFELSAPTLTAFRGTGTFELSTPTLTAFRGTGTFELSAPTLTAFRSTGTFKLTMETLTALREQPDEVSGSRTAETTATVAIKDIVSDEFPFVLSRQPRICNSLYACSTKEDIRNAIRETALRKSPSSADFCEAVDEYLGQRECVDGDFKRVINFNFGINILGDMTQCPALEAYQSELEKVFNEGKETYYDEVKIEQAMMKVMPIMLSGDTEAFCEAISSELGLSANQ